jgi:hypothetical protein
VAHDTRQPQAGVVVGGPGKKPARPRQTLACIGATEPTDVLVSVAVLDGIGNAYVKLASGIVTAL